MCPEQHRTVSHCRAVCYWSRKGDCAQCSPNGSAALCARPACSSERAQTRHVYSFPKTHLRQLGSDLCGDSKGAQPPCYLCGVSPYGAASGNQQRRQHREIVAVVLQQLVCDLCGDSKRAKKQCFFCGVSSYGAASGNRQPRSRYEIVAAVLRQLVCDLCGDSGVSQRNC